MELVKSNREKQEEPNQSSLDIGRVTAILDKGASFEGRLTFEGTVRISGRFKGEIFTKDTLVIDSGADVEAQIEANVVVISGTMKGKVLPDTVS